MKKIYFVLLLFVPLNLQIAFANEFQILEDRINQAKGVPKIELLNHLSDSLLLLNPHKSKDFALFALQESITIKNENLKATSLYNLAYSCNYLGEFNQGITYLNESIKLSTIQSDLEFQVDILTLKGIMQKSSNQYYEANKTYETALDLCLRLKKNSKTAMLLNNSGNVFEAQGDFESAVKSYLSALRYYNPDKDSLAFALGYINLGKMFLNLENFMQAREFFQTALNFCTPKMLNEKAVINNCLGTIYFAHHNNEAALMLFNKALTFSESINDKRNLAIILSNIAEVHRSREKFPEALKHYALAQEINTKYHYNFGASNIEINLANLYMMQKDMTKAKEKLDLACSMIDKYNFKSLKLELFDKYAKFFTIKGDLKTALVYKDKYIKLKDTISYIDRNRKLNSLVAKFTMEDKDKQIEGYEASQRIMDLEVAQHRNQVILLVLVILFIVSILGFFLYRYFILKKQDKILNESNVELNKSIERETEISKMNKRILSLLAHDIKVPISAVLTISQNIQSHLAAGDIEKANDRLNGINRTVNNINRLIMQFLDISRYDKNKFNIKIEKFVYTDFITNIVNEDFQNSLDHHHNFILNLPEKPVVGFIDSLVADHIFHNIISNAVKYSPNNTDINIDLSVNNGILYFSVKDRGRGIPFGEQDMLFNKFHRFSNTDGVPGTGLGLYLVKRTMNELGGSIELISAENQGTTVNISFPMDTRV